MKRPTNPQSWGWLPLEIRLLLNSWTRWFQTRRLHQLEKQERRQWRRLHQLEDRLERTTQRVEQQRELLYPEPLPTPLLPPEVTQEIQQQLTQPLAAAMDLLLEPKLEQPPSAEEQLRELFRFQTDGPPLPPQ